MQVFHLTILSSSFPQIVVMSGTGNRSIIHLNLRNRISSNGHCFSRGFGILPAFQILAGSLTVGRSVPRNGMLTDLVRSKNVTLQGTFSIRPQVPTQSSLLRTG